MAHKGPYEWDQRLRLYSMFEVYPLWWPRVFLVDCWGWQGSDPHPASPVFFEAECTDWDYGATEFSFRGVVPGSGGTVEAGITYKMDDTDLRFFTIVPQCWVSGVKQMPGTYTPAWTNWERDTFTFNNNPGLPGATLWPEAQVNLVRKPY